MKMRMKTTTFIKGRVLAGVTVYFTGQFPWEDREQNFCAFESPSECPEPEEALQKDV